MEKWDLRKKLEVECGKLTDKEYFRVLTIMTDDLTANVAMGKKFANSDEIAEYVLQVAKITAGILIRMREDKQNAKVTSSNSNHSVRHGLDGIDRLMFVVV